MPVGKSNVGEYIQNVLGSIARLNQNQEQVRQENTTVRGPAVGPQTPGQGLMQGILNGWRRQTEEAHQADRAVKEQALAFLEAIPDSEHNTPLKMKMALQIMQSKPGDKKGLMSVFQPEPDLDYRAQMLAKIQGMIPTRQEQGLQRDNISVDPEKVDFTDQEGSYKDLGLLYSQDGTRTYSRKINNRTGKEEITEVKTPQGEGLRGEKVQVAQTRAAAKATVPDAYAKKQRFLALDMLNKKYEDQGIVYDSLEDPDINDTDLKIAMKAAGSVVAKEIEDKAIAAGKRPEQIDADIAAKRGLAPNTNVDPSTGLKPSEQTARDDKAIAQGAEIQKELGTYYADLKAAEGKLNSLKTSSLGSKTFSYDRPADRGFFSGKQIKEITDEETNVARLRGKLTDAENRLKSNFGGVYKVEYDEDGKTPKGASLLNGAAPGTTIPKPTAKKAPVAKSKDLDWQAQRNSMYMPRQLTTRGYSNYAPEPGYLKNDLMRGMPEVDGIKLLAISPKAPEVRNAQLNTKVRLAGKTYIVKYIADDAVVLGLANGNQ